MRHSDVAIDYAACILRALVQCFSGGPPEFQPESLFRRFRFPRRELLQLIDTFAEDLNYPCASMQLLVALRFYVTGSFQEVIGDTFGVSKATICNIIHRVSRVLAAAINKYVKFDRQPAADQMKRSVVFFPSRWEDFLGLLHMWSKVLISLSINGCWLLFCLSVSRYWRYIPRCQRLLCDGWNTRWSAADRITALSNDALALGAP